VIVKNGSNLFEATVNLRTLKVLVWRKVEGVQPTLLPEDWEAVRQLVRSDPDWLKAVRTRGIDKVNNVVCVPLPVGYLGTGTEEGHRLARVISFDSNGTKNYWGRPIEGLVALVDLDEAQVLSITDTGVVPVPRGPVDLNAESVGPLRRPPNRIDPTQEHGPSFRVRGQTIEWQKWFFHFRVDPRLGLVVSLVRYNDAGEFRSILYQGSVSEMFVPYMDPSETWYFRTYMDAGEYGLGKLSAPLQPGRDCPSNAVFFDAVFADERGVPYVAPRVACLFERYSGDIAWRHYESFHDASEVRRRTDLVLRHVAAVANYDYIFDWVFRQDGTIRIAVGATGTVQVKAVASRKMRDESFGRDTAYGRLVAEHTVGTNHDHFFCFRLDLDVDGRNNSFLLDRLKTRLLDTGPRRSLWVIDAQTALTESSAKFRINLEKPALWRVVNSEGRGALGHLSSYQLKPGTNAVSLMDSRDPVQRRAGFTDYHLWVTPYAPSERYAAGVYPNQGPLDAGLPRWTSANRPVRNTDIVLWYTLGFHHVVRSEDWPVLPTSWHTFELRPFNFFARNPALDLPE